MKKPVLVKQFLFLAFVLLLAIGCSSGLPTQADAAGEKMMSVDEAQEVLKKFDPSIQVKAVEAAPIPGLYEVIVTVKGEMGIVYISAEKKHVILGSIVDVETKSNLTKDKFEAAKSKYEPKADFGSIDLSDAVVLGDAKAKHQVVVFDDPDWPYCAKLHQVMKQVQKDRKDIAFFIKMFPLVQIHPESYAKAKAIVCEKEANGDEAALKMLEEAYDHKPVPAPSCETDAVDKGMKLAQDLGLRGTPALVFKDGTIMKGAVSPDTITKHLDSLK